MDFWSSQKCINSDRPPSGGIYNELAKSMMSPRSESIGSSGESKQNL